MNVNSQTWTGPSSTWRLRAGDNLRMLFASIISAVYTGSMGCGIRQLQLSGEPCN